MMIGRPLLGLHRIEILRMLDDLDVAGDPELADFRLFAVAWLRHGLMSPQMKSQLDLNEIVDQWHVERRESVKHNYKVK